MEGMLLSNSHIMPYGLTTPTPGSVSQCLKLSLALVVHYSFHSRLNRFCLKNSDPATHVALFSEVWAFLVHQFLFLRQK